MRKTSDLKTGWGQAIGVFFLLLSLIMYYLKELVKNKM